jgi:hypothetical protein
LGGGGVLVFDYGFHLFSLYEQLFEVDVEVLPFAVGVDGGAEEDAGFLRRSMFPMLEARIGLPFVLRRRECQYQENALRNMKILFYILAVVFGLLSLLAVLRTIERLLSGIGLLPSQLLIALVALLLAGVCLRKARSKEPKAK